MNVAFGNFGRGLKKGNIIAHSCRGLHYLSMDIKNSFFGLLRIFEKQKSETMSKLPKKSEKMQIEGEQRRIATI